jgi:hypothetical protein
LIAENMIINSDLIHQSNGRIELTTVNTLEHRSGTIQALSDITMNTGRIIQTGGTISTNRLEVLSSDTAQFESSSNEIGRLNATIDTGNFSFVHAGDLFIEHVKANTVNLTSINGSILADGNRSIIDIDSMNVEMTAANEIKDINFANQASITATGDKISLIADKYLMLVNLSASEISVKSTRQLAVGQLTANEIDLQASQINHIDGQIRANQLQLNTLYGAGTETNYLETQVTLLDVVNQYSGDIYISNTGQLILNNLNYDNRAIDNMGGGRILTDDSLIISSEIQQSNDFTIQSQNDLTIAGNIINIGSSKVELVSGAALIQQSGILLNDGGKMSLQGKSITQQSGELLTGILEMIASDAIDLTKGSNNADILKASASSLTYKDKNEIMIQEIHTSNDINLIAGRISDHADDQLVDVTSDNNRIYLETTGNITGIDLADGSKLNVQSTGDIELFGIGQLNVDHIYAKEQTIDISTTGNLLLGVLEANIINVSSMGDIQAQVNEINVIADTIKLDANGAITGTSGAINLADGAKVWATTIESDINLHGMGEITLADIQTEKDVHITAEKRIVASIIDAQNIQLSTSDMVEANQMTADNRIVIQSEGIMSSSQSSMIISQSLVLKSETGIGISGNSLNTSVDQLDAENTTIGDIYISNTGKLDLVDLDGDNMAINNAGGGIIETHSPMTILSDIIQTNDFSLIAGEGNADDDTLTIKANIENKSGSHIHLKAGKDIVQQAGSITSQQVDLKGKNIIQTGGGIKAETVFFDAVQNVDYQSQDNEINTIGANIDTGNFTFTSHEAVSISKIISGGSVTINARSIQDQTTDTDADIQATGNIVLNATQIGSETNDLDIGSNANLTASAIDSIYLQGTGNITLTDITSTNDIIIKTSEGDLTVQNITTEKSVELSSEKGAIKKADNSSILADSLIVKAKSGIDIATQAEKIDAIVIGPGDIQIDESDQVLLNTLTTFEGSIVVNAGGSLEAMEVHSVDGDVTINAQGDMIARKISATKRTHSDIHDVTLLSTIGGNMTIDLLVADDAVVINVEDGELMDDNDADVDIHARTLIGDVSNINRVKFDVSNLSLTSLQNRILTYHDYLQPVVRLMF